jgi:hypothetical protein
VDRAAAKARASETLSSRYQTTIPEDEPEPPSLSLPPWLAELARYGIYALGALAIVAAVLLILRSLRGDGPWGSTDLRSDAMPSGSASSSRPTLADADRLAAAGAYRDAVHLLLLVAIVEAAQSTDAAFPPSTTSRELTTLLPLPDHPRARFGELVAAVERSIFGGGEVEPHDYAVCRERCLAVAGRAA